MLCGVRACRVISDFNSRGGGRAGSPRAFRLVSLTRRVDGSYDVVVTGLKRSLPLLMRTNR